MKFKDGLKIVLIGLLIAVMLFGAILPAFAAEGDNLPRVVKWVNGGAQTVDGSFLNDEWAVDDTGVSDKKYVLINQQGTEEMRVAKYPDDISGGNTDVAPTYKGSFSLAVPESVTGEVAITFESNAATYDVYFNEGNKYSAHMNFLPGSYKVKMVEVASDLESEYGLQDNTVIEVKDKAFSFNLKVEKRVQEEVTDEKEDEGIFNRVSSYDTNGDLLGDTLKMLVTIAVLFIGYSLIKRRREKQTEVNR